MSILIKGMEMPKNCGRCWFNKSSLSCAITGSCIDRDDENRERLDDCPFVEVPKPHGALIDRDILEQELRNGIKAGNLEEGYENYANINSTDDCVECVRYAETVIEAEGE